MTIISADKVTRVGSCKIRASDVAGIRAYISDIAGGGNPVSWGFMVTLLPIDDSVGTSMYVVKHHESWGTRGLQVTHIGGADNAAFSLDLDTGKPYLYVDCTRIANIYVAINFAALWT